MEYLWSLRKKSPNLSTKKIQIEMKNHRVKDKRNIKSFFQSLHESWLAISQMTNSTMIWLDGHFFAVPVHSTPHFLVDCLEERKYFWKILYLFVWDELFFPSKFTDYNRLNTTQTICLNQQTFDKNFNLFQCLDTNVSHFSWRYI